MTEPAPEQGPSEPCPDCHGTGWAPVEDRPDAPLQRCGCRQAQRRFRRLEAATIPPRYQRCTLDNFHTGFKEAHASLEANLTLCRRYVERFPEPSYGLLFMGPPGVGKTHLAVGVLRSAIEEHGVRGKFADFRDLLRDLQDTYDPDAELSEAHILRPLREAELLLLDELGARRPSAWARDVIEQLVNERYNRRRITLITTNFVDRPPRDETTPRSGGWRRKERDDVAEHDRISLEERVGSRLRSRLHEMCKDVVLEGPDFRELVKKR